MHDPGSAVQIQVDPVGEANGQGVVDDAIAIAKKAVYAPANWCGFGKMFGEEGVDIWPDQSDNGDRRCSRSREQRGAILRLKRGR
jgi:hypothetical protein